MKQLLPLDYAWISLLLSQGKDTRYGLMQKSNKLLQYVHPALKPGSFYPRLLKFERQKLVKIEKDSSAKWVICPTLPLQELFENSVISQGISYLDTVPIYWHIIFRSLLQYQNAALFAKFLSLSKTRLFALRAELESIVQKISDNEVINLAINFERLKELHKIEHTIMLKNWHKLRIR